MQEKVTKSNYNSYSNGTTDTWNGGQELDKFWMNIQTMV